VAHYKKQYGVSGEMLTATYLLLKGFNVFQPVAVSNRDLLVEIDGRFYGIQCKSSFKPYKDKKRHQQRYKFNFGCDGQYKYSPETVQVFACISLSKKLVLFYYNEGQRSFTVNEKHLTFEKQEECFESTLKKIKQSLQLPKGYNYGK